MSSIPNPVSRRPAKAPKASGLLPSTESVRQTLHQHLRKTASFIKFMDGLVLLARWVTAILAIWLAACVVDHWLWPLPSAGRWLFWSAGIAACGWWLVWQFLPLLIGRINPLYAAKRIEHLVPEFKNGLIAWLELETLPEQRVPVGVMSALAHRAARFIGGQDPSATVDTSPLIKMIGSVLILTTSLALYAMLTPKSVLATGQRILFPWSSLAPPTRVKILEVTPGSVELTQGKPLAVEVTVKGIGRDDTVSVRYSSLDGQLQNQRTELSANSEGFRYSGDVRTNGSGVEQPLDYWIEAGDAQQGPFRVTISPLPAVVLQTIELQFPPYTRLPNRTIGGEEVEAVEGTQATITARANQTLQRGRLEINPTLDENGDVVRADSFINMTSSDRKLQATLPLLLDSQGSNPTRIEYRIRGTNSRGDSNARPITHRLSVLADVAPEVDLLGPENRLLRVHQRARVNLEVRASDPDFGLTRLTLHAKRDGVAAAPIVLLEDADGVRGRQVKTYQVDLTRWQAQIGQRFELRAQAADNRHDPRTGQPAPNSAESQLLTLLVVADQEPADASTPFDPQAPDTPPGSESGAGEQSNAPSESPTAQSESGGQANSGSANAGESSPGEQDTAKQGSGEQGASEQTPQEQNSGEQSSGQQSSGQQSSGEQSSGQQSSGQQSSGQQSSGEQSSGQQSSGQQSSGQQRSGEQSSGEQSSGQQSSGQQSSGQQSSGQQSSGQQSSGQQSSGQQSSGQQDAGKSGESPSGADNNSGANSDAAAQGASGDKSAESPSRGKPANDGEAMERVSEYLKSQNADSDSQPANSQPSDSQSANSQPSESPSGENSEAQGAESEGSPAQASEPPASDSKGSEPQGSDSQGSDSQGSDPQGSESKGSDSQGSDSQGSDSQGSDSQGSDPQGSDSKGSDSKGSDSKGSDSKGSDSLGADSKGSDPQGSDSKGSDSKSSDSQGSNSQGSDSKSSDSQGSDSQGSDSQGSDSKGSDSKGSDSKGSDSKGSDSKGSDSKGSDSQGSDSQGSDSQGSDSQGSDSQGSDSQGSDSQGSDSQGSDSQGSDSQGSDSQGSESKGSDSQGSDSKGSDSQGSDSQGSQSQGSQSPSSSSAPPNPNQPTGSGTGTHGGQGGSTGSRAAADREFAEQTTNMVLDYLNRQKEQPEPELLRELDWTADDLQSFVERWNAARDLADSDQPADRLKWQQMLEQLNMTPPEQRVRQGSSRNDSFQQMQDGGARLRAPESLRKQFDAYRKALEAAQQP